MKNVSIKLYRVMKELDPMRKNHKTNTGNSRKISEVLERVHPLLEQHGLIFIPVAVRDYKQGQITTKSGSIASFSSYIQTFNLIDIDSGEFIVIEVPTEGQDAGGTDKATRVANSYAMKTALENMFMIVERDSPQKNDSKPSLPITVVELPSPKDEILIEDKPKQIESNEFFTAKNSEQKSFLTKLIRNGFEKIGVKEPSRDSMIKVWTAVNGNVYTSDLEVSIDAQVEIFK